MSPTKPKASKPSILPIIWDANQQALTWALINKLEKHENFKVLFGKQDLEEVCEPVLTLLYLTDSMYLL